MDFFRETKSKSFRSFSLVSFSFFVTSKKEAVDDTCKIALVLREFIFSIPVMGDA